MTEKTINRKRRMWIQGAIGVLVLALFISAAIYLTSDSFRSWARGRIVTQLEDATGGKVEIGDLKWNLSKLEFDLHNVTIHGLEQSGEVPYAHADRLLIRVKILSFMRREVGLRWLQIEKPVIHLIVYPGGHTNQPTPKVVAKRGENPVQRLFEIDVRHAEANGGTLIVNEQRLPLDFSVNDLHASMDHVVGTTQRYDGKVSLSSMTAKYATFLPTQANAELEFSLYPNKLDLRGFHMVSGKSKVDASGSLVDFLKPVVQVTYRASLDGTELGKMAKLSDLRGGVMDVQGTAHYEADSFGSIGKLVLHDLDYRAGQFRLRNIDAASDFTLNERDLKLTHVVGRVFGGIVKGDITIIDFTGARQSNGKPAPPESGLARLRVDAMPAGNVAEVLSTKKLDFGQLRLVGTAQGTVVARWKGSVAHAVADLDVTVTPSAQPRAEELPVTGELHGTFDLAAGKLHADTLDVAIPSARAQATGTLGVAAESLKLSLAVDDLRRLEPMFRLLNAQNSTAADLTGKLNFEGTISGRLNAPSIQGHLQASDFTFPLAAVMTPNSRVSAAQPTRIHLDSGSGDITYTPKTLLVRNGVLKRAGAQANVDLSAGLEDGLIVDSSPIGAHLMVRDASFSDLQQIAGFNYPVTGTVGAVLNIIGTRGNPEGGGHVQLVNGTLYGEPVKSAQADVRLLNQEARVTNLLVVHNGARVTGSGNYNLDTTAFQFQATGTNFQLSTIKRLATTKASLAGTLNFNATGSGTARAPIINASARLQNLVVNGQRVGDATLTAITQGDSLKVTSRSNFQNAQLTADGTVKMHDRSFPANIKVHFDNFDFMPFIQAALLNRVSAKSYVGGDITLQGPLARPQELTMTAEIPTLRADMQGIELHNTEPIRLSMANQVIRIESFHMVGLDTELTARGTVDANGNHRIRVRANGRLNLKLVQSFNPDINSAGLVDFNLNMGGVMARPTLQGEVRVLNGSVNLIDFPNGLSNINGSLMFTEDRVQVQSLTAHTGGGDIQIGGYATGPQLNFNLTAQGHDIRLRYPKGVSSTANIDLKLTGSLTNSTLSGDVTVTRFGFNNQFDLADYLARSNAPMEVPQASLLNNLHMNLHVVSTPELQVQSSLAKLAGNVDLRVRGTGTNPVVLGRVNFTEGQFSFNGQDYRLERGDVLFNNPTKTEPTLDVEATTRVRDYDLTVHLAGQPSHGLKPTFRSDPPLPEADVINLLAFGRTREEAEIASTQTSTTFTDTVSNAVLGQAINQTFSNRVQKLFGVSRIKISPEIGSTQTNPSAQLTVEQQVSNKVTITYISNLTQASQQGIFVEYNINRDLSIVAGRDQYGVVSFDVHVRRRKR